MFEPPDGKDRLLGLPKWCRPYAGVIIILISAVGAAIAIGGMEYFSAWAGTPIWAIPFATSIVSVMGAPESAPAQPRALIGGHLISTLIGLALLKLAGPSPYVAAIAVGMAVLAMQLTGTFHPPAGIDPLIVVVNALPWTFLFVPVLSGAVLLMLFALFWMNIIRGYRWPNRWW